MHLRYRNPDVDFPLPEHSSLNVSPETHQEVRRNFAAMVEHLDECAGRLIAKVEERGELDNTLIVFSSDHGEMLGDYNLWQKLAPHQNSIGVPLMVAGPGVKPQEPCDKPTTILDLHATFLEYAGVKAPDSLDTRSLCGTFRGEDTHRKVVRSGLSAWRLAFDGRYKLIKGYDPEKRHGGNDWEPMHMPDAAQLQEERESLLWDITNNENENIASQHSDIVAELSRYLET